MYCFRCYVILHCAVKAVSGKVGKLTARALREASRPCKITASFEHNDEHADGSPSTGHRRLVMATAS
ncbi:MAG: hypothetical protein LBN11_04805 [Tannerella sp.]|nr:hypothetical protein [Tannerella sp.]